ncbi:hypothetical protein SCP_0206080 [Sparassis crispa]|uniref:Transcription initiation factor TFIID subunit 8 n=1 Tax=Sparassis crispa TaxID=139825 RepID=A0A401GB58_9APHY|nr:hypothetical protein SCP_0206080 [Sparassis crispa]GBE79410.1 hypothetical protein SCP_0206080 [Sparassis crispa]
MSASYYPSQAYGSYQASYPAYPPQNAYPSAQYVQSPTAAYSTYPTKATTPPLPESHTAPEISAVTPELASHALQRLLSCELRDAGFDAAQPTALQRLELEVVALVEQLYQRAHEYANLANRAAPIATDLLLASHEYGMQTSELHHLGSGRKQGTSEILLLPPPSRSPSPELLSSDDEGTPTVIPATLRSLPHYIPALPPKHTYLRTPISPPKKAALPSLEKKLKNAGLVQESLKNLLLATEDSTGQEDAELLGATVNWETNAHPRKRWRLS